MNPHNKLKCLSKIYYLIFFTSLFLGLLKIYDKCVDGFYISRIYGFLPYDSSFDLKYEQSDLEKAQSALNHSFHYLSSGSQCFVFVSDDGQYVLKLFKNYRWKTPYIFKVLPNISFFSRMKERLCNKKTIGITKTYHSAKLSYTELKKKSGLIYLQLNTHPQKSKNIILYNRLKKKYILDISQVPFALQFYAKPVSQVLLSYKKANDLDNAKKCIDQLINYALQRRTLNITDSDPHFINNFGYINNQPISLDIGGLLIDPKKDHYYFYTKELQKMSDKIIPWAHRNYPELEPYIKQTFKDLNAQFFKK